MIDLTKHFNDFFLAGFNKVDIYNEASLQLEAVLFLRKTLPEYKVHIQKSKEFFKASSITKTGGIDISVFNDDMSEKYAIELKYLDYGAGVPATMFKCVEDVKACEELKMSGFTNTYCIALAINHLFYKGDEQDGIYKYFRMEHSIYGTVSRPTGKGKHNYFTFHKKHDFEWKDVPGHKEKYYVIEI